MCEGVVPHSREIRRHASGKGRAQEAVRGKSPLQACLSSVCLLPQQHLAISKMMDAVDPMGRVLARILEDRCPPVCISLGRQLY